MSEKFKIKSDFKKATRKELRSDLKKLIEAHNESVEECADSIKAMATIYHDRLKNLQEQIETLEAKNAIQFEHTVKLIKELSS